MKQFELNKKSAQQLVEFLLVVPFIIIILGVVTEYAYALNINMTLNEALKAATASIYSEIKPGMTASSVQTQVLGDFKNYLSQNNAPVNAENKVNVNYVIVNQTAVFMATYTYVPAFTLPNVYFHILPNEFDFFTTVAVPATFLNANNYTGAISSTTLDGVWGASSFASLSDFNNYKNGIMTTNIGSNPSTSTNMLFLVPDSTTPTNYYLTHWDGTVDDCVFASDTGKISGADCGTYNDGALIDYLTGNNYYNVIFIHDTAVPATVNTAALSGLWVTGSGKLSDTSAGGILKRALALINSTNLSIGNYDNLIVSNYNFGVSSGNVYSMKAYGAMVLVYTSSDNISNITTGTPPSYGYDFKN